MADTLRDLDPAFRYEMAEAIAAYGKASVEEREAYAVALTLLDAFPTDHRLARDAARLRSDLVMRQQLPTADRRPVSDAEQAEFLAKILRDAQSQPRGENAGAVPSTAPPAPHGPPPAYNYLPTSPGGPVQVRGHFRNGRYVQPHTRSAPRR